MSKQPLRRRIFIILLFVIGVFWIKSEMDNSYSEPQQAFNSVVENPELIVPAYKINDRALFFSFKENNLGAAVIKKGIFGWKPGFVSWSPIDIPEQNEFSSYKSHGETLIYGLYKGRGNTVRINDFQTRGLEIDVMLDELTVEKLKLGDVVLWYEEMENPDEDITLQFVNGDGYVVSEETLH